jgi:hypothetical protein
MPGPEELIAYCGLASLEGALVLLPRQSGSALWRRLRSPLWALVLPSALVIGTFGVLEVPHGATKLAVLATLATPLLVGMAVLGIVRGPRWPWLAALPVLGGALTLHSWPGGLAATVLTALGCVTLGTALVRLTPLPWLAAGIAAMCIVDVALLATGVGQPAAHQLEDALSHSGLPEFHRAQIGSMNRDYPDLVLAAVLGAVLAGNARRQRTAAVLVTVLAAANGLLFLVADMLPATVPVGVAAVLLLALERRSQRRRSPRARRAKPRVGVPATRRPGGAQPIEA